MIRSVDMLFVIKRFDRFGLFAVGKPPQNPREAQRHITRILALTERFPLRILGGIKDLSQVARIAKLRKTGEIEKIGTGPGNKRGVSGGGNVGYLVEEFNIFRMLSKFVVANDCTKG